jgi:hypothetical protein
MAMTQAFLPNSERPPFYANLMVELKGDELVVSTGHVEKLRKRFLSERNK